MHKVFTVALFVIAKEGNQSKCPSAGNRWNKLYYTINYIIYAMECCRVVRKDLGMLMYNTECLL